MKTTLLLTVALSLLSAPALADCDIGEYDYAATVPEFSYAHVVAMPEASAPFPECETEAEDVECEAEGLYGLACAAKMQRLYSRCVGEELCRDAVQGWSEDDGVTGESLGFMFTGCLDLVAAAGGPE
jgi:hypothetical protein